MRNQYRQFETKCIICKFHKPRKHGKIKRIGLKQRFICPDRSDAGHTFES